MGHAVTGFKTELAEAFALGGIKEMEEIRTFHAIEFHEVALGVLAGHGRRNASCTKVGKSTAQSLGIFYKTNISSRLGAGVATLEPKRKGDSRRHVGTIGCEAKAARLRNIMLLKAGGKRGTRGFEQSIGRIEHGLACCGSLAQLMHHVLRNASGNIKRKVNELFDNTLRESAKKDLCTLIYYPEERLEIARR